MRGEEKVMPAPVSFAESTLQMAVNATRTDLPRRGGGETVQPSGTCPRDWALPRVRVRSYMRIEKIYPRSFARALAARNSRGRSVGWTGGMLSWPESDRPLSGERREPSSEPRRNRHRLLVKLLIVSINLLLSPFAHSPAGQSSTAL